MENIHISERIQNALRDRKLILFVGSGISSKAKAPTWPELIRGIMNDSENFRKIRDERRVQLEDMIRTNDLSNFFMAIDYLMYKLNNTNVVDVIEKTLSTLEPEQIHYTIAKLKLKGIITTNYDKLIELARHQVDRKLFDSISLEEHRIKDLLNKEGWIFKIHGDIDSKVRILTYENYLFFQEQQLWRSIIQDLMRSNTFLFIGFGLRDPDILDILKELNFISRKAGGFTHYALVRRSDDFDIRSAFYFKYYGLELVPYKDHSFVDAYLEKLLEVQEKIMVTNKLKILVLLIKATQSHSYGDLDLLLVTNDKNWSVEYRENIRKVYLFPSIRLGKNVDWSDLKKNIQSYLNLGEDDFEFELNSEQLFETKLDLGTNQLTEYTFLFAGVRITNPTMEFKKSNVLLRDRRHYWLRQADIEADMPTIRYNSGVINHAKSLFGISMENLPSSKIDFFEDADFINDASLYNEAGWVIDEGLFDKIIEIILKDQKDCRVLDLGCGGGNFGKYLLKKRPNDIYIGIERNSEQFAIANNFDIEGGSYFVERADFMDDFFAAKHDGKVFLLKNVLHTMPSLSKVIEKVKNQFGKPAKVIIVETISPDQQSNDFVQVLFEQIDHLYKFHYFTEPDLLNKLNMLGCKIVSTSKVEQFISVNKWLSNKRITEQCRQKVFDFIENQMDNHVKTVMQKQVTEDGDIILLRLQIIVEMFF